MASGSKGSSGLAKTATRSSGGAGRTTSSALKSSTKQSHSSASTNKPSSSAKSSSSSYQKVSRNHDAGHRDAGTKILAAILEQRIPVETLDLANLVALRDDRILVIALTIDNLPIKYLLVLRITQGLLPHAPLTNIHPLTTASTIHRPRISTFNQETATSYAASSDASRKAGISQNRNILPLSIDEEVEE